MAQAGDVILGKFEDLIGNTKRRLRMHSPRSSTKPIRSAILRVALRCKLLVRSRSRSPSS